MRFADARAALPEASYDRTLGALRGACPKCGGQLEVGGDPGEARFACWGEDCDEAMILAAAGSSDTHSLDPVGLFPLLSVADLRDLKPPEFLVDGLVPRDGFSVLYGPSGVGKSFLALDWAFCVASGFSWYGNATQAGPVLYIAAEGRAGLGIRAGAWHEARNAADVDAIRFLPETVNFLDAAQREKAHRTLEAMNPAPVLIVIDTMARSMVGGDENASRDVGLFIDAIDRLRGICGAAALVVHHTGKNGEDERGSSALRGAADMMHALRPESSGIRLECAKAKDSEEYDPWSLHLSTVADSCVLRLGSSQFGLGTYERQILAELSAAFGSDPATSAQLQKASGVAERSYYRAVKSLEDRDYVHVEPRGRSKLYTLTDLGRSALLPTTANDCPADAGTTAANATPLGVAVGSHPGSEQREQVSGEDLIDADAEMARLEAKGLAA